ncbi:dTDP-4-dehydrorhamnose reductase [Ferrovibrio terrae]|uniref:dTDP-4-dehydrorhamnose reductase n=1 Tax=Ferrovibrio terrae TaxID=2594003 RepID=A0A516H791_9PROT|nr:dTDP-4-dehydrorhamnose reductase [Ferrovibrio terrae]
MRVAVIGTQGQLARSLAELSGDDAAITCIGRPLLDLAEPETVAVALDELPADIVVNAAAYTAVDRAESEADLAFAINRDGAAAVADVCARRNLPLIHLSTDYVFDGTGSGAWRETDACHPQSVYGASKLAGEQAVLAAFPAAVILRTAWLHSPFGTNFVKTMLRLSAERDRLRVVADQHGSPTYAPDLATAILAMARRLAGARDAALSGIFHLAGSGETTWHGLAVTTMAMAGRGILVDPISTADYPTPVTRPANSVLATAKIAAAYGIRLPPWQEGVRHGVARLLSHE